MPILPTTFLVSRKQPNANETITIPLTQHKSILANLTNRYNTIGIHIFLSCWFFTCLLILLFLLRKIYYIYRPMSLVRSETAALEAAVRRFVRLGEGWRREGVRRVFEAVEGRTGRDVGEQVFWIVGRVVEGERGREMERRRRNGGREGGTRRARLVWRW